MREMLDAARKRMEEDQYMRTEPRTVYGGPPPPVKRRWTLRGILMLIAGAVAAIAGAIWGFEKMAAPVYGGPPSRDPQTVYGGPVAPGPGQAAQDQSPVVPPK